MFTPLQIFGLVVFNLFVFLLAYIAFRLISDQPAASRRVDRREVGVSDELFSFDSWSGQGAVRQSGHRPGTGEGR